MNVELIVVISCKMVKPAKNTISDTWVLNSQRHEISEILGHTVVISRETVKSANRICHTWALNCQRYEISEILGHIVVIIRKSVYDWG